MSLKKTQMSQRLQRCDMNNKIVRFNQKGVSEKPKKLLFRVISNKSDPTTQKTDVTSSRCLFQIAWFQNCCCCLDHWTAVQLSSKTLSTNESYTVNAASTLARRTNSRLSCKNILLKSSPSNRHSQRRSSLFLLTATLWKIHENKAILFSVDNRTTESTSLSTGRGRRKTKKKESTHFIFPRSRHRNLRPLFNHLLPPLILASLIWPCLFFFFGSLSKFDESSEHTCWSATIRNASLSEQP